MRVHNPAPRKQKEPLGPQEDAVLREMKYAVEHGNYSEAIRIKNANPDLREELLAIYKQ